MVQIKNQYELDDLIFVIETSNKAMLRVFNFTFCKNRKFFRALAAN
jgi:hypothetical protein